MIPCKCGHGQDDHLPYTPCEFEDCPCNHYTPDEAGPAVTSVDFKLWVCECGHADLQHTAYAGMVGCCKETVCPCLQYKPAARPSSPPDEPSDERKYPCDRCGTMRTKAEGGTIFTLCDECWDRTPKISPAPPTSQIDTSKGYVGNYGDQLDAALNGHLRATYTRSDLEAVAREAVGRALANRKMPHDGESVHECVTCSKLAAEVVTRYLQTRAEK